MDITASIALVVTHRTRPGERDAVRAVWRRHMASAVEANPGHLAYYYCLDPVDPDVITAFQHYRSSEDAAAFVQTDAYRAYEQEVAPHLTGAPHVQRLSVDWTKDQGPSLRR